jgi:hypothetical protein
MTTIATDGKTIAADGQNTSGWEIVDLQYEKIRAVNGSVYATSGDAGMLDPLIAWSEAGAAAKDVPQKYGDGWSFLVISREGRKLYTSGCPYPTPVPKEFTLGSGGDYARGAMRAGKSPAEAVAIAIELDAASGGTIRVIDIAEVLGTTPVVVTLGFGLGFGHREAAE